MHQVLHLHWRPAASTGDEPGFLLWAEESVAPQPPRQKGRLAAKPRARQHPFAVTDLTLLRAIIQQCSPGLITQGDKDITLLMPSTRTGPLPSPELIHDWQLDMQTPRLAPWIIHGLQLPIASGIEFLARLQHRTAHDPFVFGSDLQYWLAALNLVFETLARQRYVPSLQSLDQGVVASLWQPVQMSERAKHNLRALHAAMPPVCRSEPDHMGETPQPTALLDDFITALCDHLIRLWSVDAPHRLGYLHNRDSVSVWLKSLAQPEPVVIATGPQAEVLTDEVRTWHQNLTVVGDTSFAVGLRLLPPPKNGEKNGHLHVPESGWKLEYLLQARNDPLTMVAADQVWQGQSENLVIGHHRFERPQEKLLLGLGQAARIFPPVERSLRSPAPTGMELTTAEVYSFLRNAAPLLEQNGFSLVLPPWWEAAGARLGLRIYLTPILPQPPDYQIDPDGEEKPVCYRWELVLGDTVITQEAFAELVALRSPLVQHHGRWLRLDPEQIEAGERFLERQRFEGVMDLQQALRVCLGLDDKFDIAGLPVVQTIAEGWLPEIIARLTDGDDTLRQAEQPDDLNGSLRPYQRYGHAWLLAHRRLRLGACLADDMGLGKSVQAIAMLLQERAILGGLPAPTLLICPTSLLGNWRREIERFGPDLRVFTHYGSDRPGPDTFRQVVSQFDIVLTSYTLARRDAALFQDYSWHGLILDEAQRIKNPEAQVTQAIARFHSEFRMVLTGTPVENHLSELWSIFNFLNRGYLGSLQNFRRSFATPIERFQSPVETARLQRMVRPFILRRLKSDPVVIQDLPERLEMRVYCTLSEEQAELYQKVVEEGLPRIADLRGRARRIHVFNLITRLKQILNHPAQYYHQTDELTLAAQDLSQRSGKLDRLTDMLEEVLGVDERALVFTQFAESGHVISAHLRRQLEIPVLYLYGGVPARKRQQMINSFQEDPHAPRIFVLTLGTGGLGLNLTAANHVFHFDRWWNPAVEDQASDRAYRIGQTRNVQIHKFITAGTLEESIDQMLERKKGLAEAIIGSEESWLTSLSDDDLTEMLKLNTERI